MNTTYINSTKKTSSKNGLRSCFIASCYTHCTCLCGFDVIINNNRVQKFPRKLTCGCSIDWQVCLIPLPATDTTASPNNTTETTCPLSSLRLQSSRDRSKQAHSVVVLLLLHHPHSHPHNQPTTLSSLRSHQPEQHSLLTRQDGIHV